MITGLVIIQFLYILDNPASFLEENCNNEITVREQQSHDEHAVNMDNELSNTIKGPLSFLAKLWRGLMFALSYMFGICSQ